MILKLFIANLSLLMLIGSCNQSSNFNSNSTTALIDTFKRTSNFISNKSTLDFSLATNIESIDLSQFDLYGKFFNDRIQFYMSNNTNTNILNANVEHITLYFIDGVLAKSKYILSDNISSHLINTKGRFRFKALNWKNKDLAKNEDIIFKENQKHQINEKFDNYQLKWSTNSKDIIYTNKDSFELQPNNYVYSEILNHYKEVFIEIQHIEDSM